MLTAHVAGIGVYGAGWLDWSAAQRALSSGTADVAPLPDPDIDMLPPNERRRCSAPVLWALRVAAEAVRNAGVDAQTLASIFASSGGEYAVLDKICAALAEPERSVSPTLFHHSVHNAAAGYWCIGTGNSRASTSIAAYDHTFVSGLVEAVTYTVIEREPVLLTVYDLPPPAPLYAARPFALAFAMAMVITPAPAGARLATLQMERLVDCLEPTGMEQSALEAQRIGNPAARALPLLAAIARRRTQTVILDERKGHVMRVEVAMC